MTETTDSRQIRLLVNGILLSHGVDDLALESNLASAFKRYFDDRRKSKDKVGIRNKILADLKVSEVKGHGREEMQKRVKDAIGINASGNRFEGLIDWLIDEETKGKTIEQFKAWWDNENEYKRPALWKISDRPALLHELWPSAFAKKAQSWDDQLAAAGYK